MNGVDFVSKLKDLEMPVVTISASSKIIQKPSNYTRLFINRLYRRGIVSRIEGGLYCLPGTGEFTISSRIVPFSYITGYAALDHYGLTTQISTKIQVIAPKFHRPVKLRNYTVEFSKVKMGFIYGYIVTSNGPVFAEPEKIFIDDLYLHGRQYYAEEFEYSMRNGKLNVEKLRKYAKMSNNEALIKRVYAYLDGRRNR